MLSGGKNGENISISPGGRCYNYPYMKYTFSPNSSSQPYDPWQDFDIQRKADLSTYEEEIEPEEGVDDVEEDDYSDDDE